MINDDDYTYANSDAYRRGTLAGAGKVRKDLANVLTDLRKHASSEAEVRTIDGVASASGLKRTATVTYSA